MEAIFLQLKEIFLRPEVLFWASVISVLMVIAMMALLPLAVILMPQDYFLHQTEMHPFLQRLSPMQRMFFRVLKNSLGGLLILAGVAMLVLPGQGLLTILVGLTLMDGPWKQKVLQHIVRRRVIFRALNRIRQWADKPPFERPAETKAPPVD